MSEAKPSKLKPPGEVPPELRATSLLVRLLDDAVPIPGTKIRFGLDPIIGLLPGIGELIDFVLSAGIVLSLLRRGGSGILVVKMVWNIILDTLIGFIPFLGDLFDFGYKANRRNQNLALEHYRDNKHRGSAWPAILLAVALLTAVGISLFALFAWICSSLRAILGI